MEAKDTLIDISESESVILLEKLTLKNILEAQAEITWHARDKEIKEARQEVVDWIRAQKLNVSTVKELLSSNLWQAQLKTWGIE